MTFTDWFTELKRIAVEEYGWPKRSVETFDPDAWELSYEEGASPEDAFLDDLSSC